MLDGGPAYQLQNLYAGATHTVDDDHMHGADEYLQNLLNLKPLVPIAKKVVLGELYAGATHTHDNDDHMHGANLYQLI